MTEIDTAALRRSAEAAEPLGGSFSPRTAVLLCDALDAARVARDLAVAHDTQPYPTAHAYDMACAALERHRARADRAEAAIARVEALISAASIEPPGNEDCHMGRDDLEHFDLGVDTAIALVRKALEAS